MEESIKSQIQISGRRNIQFAPFPGYGKAGRPIDLIANYFELKCNLPKIYHYHIDVNSDQGGRSDKTKASSKSDSGKDVSRIEQQQMSNIGRKKCQEVLAELLKEKRLEKYKPIYDGGKNLFTASQLPIQEKTVFPLTMNVDGRSKKYMITIQPVKKVDGTNIINMQSIKTMGLENITDEVMLALNAVMNHRCSKSMEIRVGKSYFSLCDSRKVSVGEGLEIWHGYNQSVHLTQKGPAVILNLSAKVFHKSGPVIDYINEILGHNRDIRNVREVIKPNEIFKIEKSLKGVRIQVTHLPYKRKYYIKSISKVSASDYLITVDNEKLSIATYFARKYGKLKYPYLPCLHMRTSNDKTFIPVEKCEIVEGQPKLGKYDDLSKSVAASMIKQTAVPPAKRFDTIKCYASIAANECGEQMKNFNLFMDLQPKNIQGRVINPPALMYLDGKIIPKENGTWGMNGKLLKSEPNNSWIVISFADSRFCPPQKLEEFARQLQAVATSLGLHLGKRLESRIVRKDEPTHKALSPEFLKGASLAVFVISKRDYYHNYDEIKFIADYHLGLINQCVLDEIVMKMNIQIASNICLKINSKLGGINHKLERPPKVLARPIIIFGADVVHSTLCPSIASVVGSLDPCVSKYHVSCRVQENEKSGKYSQELIVHLRSMVGTILKEFYKRTLGRHPEKIIFFRDGVSEGQFPAVCEHEVRAIHQAAEDVIGHTVPLTFIVVQKRHQTRLRQNDPRGNMINDKNIPPGTLVDRDITYPNTFDFFLCSHAGIRGTSKPSRYTVLYDDSKFTADELHELCYYMCHMFVRCNKSVSIPAPVKYADLAAYRAKKYADFHLRKQYSERSSSSSSASIRQLPDFARDAINNMEKCKNGMFFV